MIYHTLMYSGLYSKKRFSLKLSWKETTFLKKSYEAHSVMLNRLCNNLYEPTALLTNGHQFKWLNWQEGLKLFMFVFFKSPSVTLLVFISILYQGAFTSKRQKLMKFGMNSINLVLCLRKTDQLLWDGHFYSHDFVDRFPICPS